ncbi:MAG: DUF1513 domain-containing protein [Hyphomicrobiaceae bacterium]
MKTGIDGIDRRRLLTAGAGMAAGLVLPARALGVGLQASPELFAAAAKDARGRFVAVIFDAATGREHGRVVLPSRGHDLVQRPRHATGAPAEVVAFARRPGNYAVVFKARAGGEPLWMTSRADRHFYGHGAFSPDGRLLFTTENDFEAGVGVIGVRDATDGYRQIGELPSGGIGPHDLAMLSDGRTLVVANGGIKTHPDTPRVELNLAEMQPTLAYVDTMTGEVGEVHALAKDLHQLSIRHLTVAAGNRVLFGCQFRGPRWQTQAIIGWHERGRDLALLTLPEDVQGAMRNYVASLDGDAAGTTVVVTAPRGGLAVVLDAGSGRYLGRYRLDKVFGVARARRQGSFVLTSGEGVLARARAIKESNAVELQRHSLVRAWDNHLLALT